MQFARTFAVAAATAVLSLGATPLAAHADEPGSEPCAKQEQQVTKAEEALARVTAVFAHQKTKVERLQEQLAAATTDEEKAKIQAKLDKALAQKQHAKKDKKAQQQRLAKAQERLANCEAAHPA
jgi:septal ring factor EnvC (AmiA/AmiB activator)